MNKLLSILAEQTFYCGNLEGDVYTGQLDLERFAQLIDGKNLELKNE